MIVILAIILLVVAFLFFKEPEKEDPYDRDDAQPLSMYDAEYFNEWKGAEFVPCISCKKKFKRVATVITSQGFKCQDCNMWKW